LIHRPLAHIGPVQRIYDRIRSSVLHSADDLFPVSTRTAELLRARGVPYDRITVVNNGVDPDEFSPRPAIALRRELAPDGPLILTVARLVSRKGIDTVLRALPALLARFPRLTYAIVGDGPDRARLSALSEALGVSARVKFSVHVGPDLVDHYNACDLFVMPVREEPGDIEGFGLVFLEAGACEKPVIGSRAGGVVDAIVDGVTGWLVPPDDVPALAQAIERGLSDPSLAASMGRAARERILRECSWGRAADRIDRAIEARISA
jgi:phosphatidylinositol alpha-1,6-mannosyltransferase